MRRYLRHLGWGTAVAAALLVSSGVARGTCDMPLAISHGGGEANVLFLLDNSYSMNEALCSDAYDAAVAYTGNFTATQTYTVSSDGAYTPSNFNRRWPATPSAMLVTSDQGESGQYSGNYLNWVYFHATTAQRAAIPTVTRIQAAKQALNAVMAGASGCRFGVIDFNYDAGGTIVAPIGTDVATIQAQVNAIRADAYTPLAETMVTALNYFQTTDANAPIQASCQKTFVVIVSDGLPTHDLDVPSYLQDYDGDGQDPGTCASLGAPYPNSMDCSGYLDDVATYLYRNDMRPDLEGIQNVATFVIGFNINAPILQATADKGGGEFFSVENPAGLAAALSEAFSAIETRVSAGAAVSVVSAEDRTNNRLFRARYESATWRGFVEAYALPYHGGNMPLWEAGALLAARNPDTRTILTSTTGTNTVSLAVANASTFVAPLGAADATEAGDVIRFTRGAAVTGARDRAGWVLGDMVDSSPLMLGKPTGYGGLPGYLAFRAANAGRTEALYVGANDGMLHCFDAADGTELWGYVPRNQLVRLRDLMSPAYCHEYFVNLTPTAYDVYVGGAWKTILVGGEERGGSGLFALDVTNPAPDHVSVMWDVDLPGLMGSWNAPTLVRDRNRGGHVLAVGTGLSATAAQAGLLELDPATGSVLATIALGSPAAWNKTTRATVIDVDFDGYDDLLYVGDLAGRLWRVDLRTSPWSATLLFDCRKPIQAAPTVTMNSLGQPMILFGTGAYLQPSDLTNTDTQTIYCVTDNGSGIAVSTGDLVDQTSSIHAVGGAQRGWYLDLVQHAGERVTRGAALIAGTLYVPSFLPNTSACAAGGQSWLYSLDYKDGSAPDHSNGSENNTTSGRVESMGDGILADPSVDLVNEALILQSSNAVLLTHDINAGLRKLMVRSWRQKWN
jgi:type IV pilus assembly protein PilY1